MEARNTKYPGTESNDLLKILPIPALLVDGAGLIVEVNAALLKLTLDSRKGLVGRSLSEAVQEPANQVAEFLRACRDNLEPMSGNFTLRQFDAAGISVQCDGAALVGPKDRAMVLLTCREIAAAGASLESSDHKIGALSAEVAMLRALQAQLEAALRGHDEFLSTASHELRNPLNALQLTLHALETMLVTGDVPSPEKLVARIGRASVQVRRLGSIIDDLIEVSRISAGRIELDIAEFDLSLMIKKLVTDLAKQKELPISFHGTEKARIVSDRGKIERILNNLLSNAIKFGQGRPVMVSLQADDARVILEVSDNGIGIPPEDLTRIFERFERSAGARGDSGFGVGLWIALRITEALGGNISARSQPAAGSVFRVELPRKSIAGTGERA